MSILGNRVLRKEDPKFLTVGGTYTADLQEAILAGAAHVTYVRSTMPHAKIVAIDTASALDAPGVIGVFTAADLGLAPAPSPFNPTVSRTLLASDVVRYVGEPVVAVVTESPHQGEDAIERVLVEYEPLETLIDMEQAMTSSTIIYPGAGSNMVLDSVMFGRPAVTDESFFDGCEVVVRRRFINQRLAPCPLEVRAGAAGWTESGRLIQYLCTQAAQGAHGVIAAVNGVETAQVRVITPDVGGGFGAKIGVYPEELLLGVLSKRLGRPMRWQETRSESMLAMGHGRAQIQDIAIGGKRDGTLLAYRLEVLQDCGAFADFGMVLAPVMTLPMSSGVYAIPKIEAQSKSIITNTTPTVPYRGAGRPEAAAAIERAIDLFASEVGMDPVDVRRKNLIPKFGQPHTTAAGQAYDVGDYEGALDRVIAAAGYKELRAEQARRRTSGSPVQLGIGVCVYVEITGGVPPTSEMARIEVLPSGKARVYTGTSPHGQGHLTAWSMIAASETGLAFDDIELVYGDTDLVPVGGGTMGSRSLQQGGAAVQKAAIELVDEARKLAAQLLEANPDDIVLDKTKGSFHVSGTPAVSKSWADLASNSPLTLETRFEAAGASFPFGAHIAVVEVDTETGRVRLARHVACDDAGKMLNPLLLEGQVHGGIAQGAAQALMEEVRYDADGNPITGNLADYAFISAAELPSFELVHMETPTFLNPLGAKGVGESGTIGSTPAVQNAVVDALAHLGVKHVDMPATPERVWRAVAAAR